MRIFPQNIFGSPRVFIIVEAFPFNEVFDDLVLPRWALLGSTTCGDSAHSVKDDAFHHKVFLPILKMPILKMSKHVFKYSVCALRFSVRLRVERCGHTAVYAQLVLKVTPELASKLAVAICDKVFRVSVMHKDGGRDRGGPHPLLWLK